MKKHLAKATLVLILATAPCANAVEIAVQQPTTQRTQQVDAAKSWVRRHWKKIVPLVVVSVLLTGRGAYRAYQLCSEKTDDSTPFAVDRDVIHANEPVCDAQNAALPCDHAGDRDPLLGLCLSNEGEAFCLAAHIQAAQTYVCGEDRAQPIGGSYTDNRALRPVPFIRDQQPAKRDTMSVLSLGRCEYEVFPVSRGGQPCGLYIAASGSGFMVRRLRGSAGGRLLSMLEGIARSRIKEEEDLPQQWREDLVLNHQFVGGQLRANVHIGNADYLAYARSQAGSFA